MVGTNAADVTLTVRKGSTVTLAEVGYGYADPESTNSTVLALTDWKPGTTKKGGRATFRSMETGRAAITLRTSGVGCLVPHSDAHCPVAYVDVMSG